MNSKPETLEEKIVRLTLENDALIERAKKLEYSLEIMEIRCETLIERVDQLKRKNSIGYN